MRFRITSERFGKLGESVRRNTMGYDKDAVMSATGIVELECKADEVVAVPRYKAALFERGALELLEVGKSFGPDLVHTDSIHSAASKQFGNSLA
jgi:hypothetical protein